MKSTNYSFQHKETPAIRGSLFAYFTPCDPQWIVAIKHVNQGLVWLGFV